MRLDEYNTGLFFIIVPAFIKALPPARKHVHSFDHSAQRQSEDRIGVNRDNAITCLRFEILQLPQVFDQERAKYDLPDDVFSSASNALEDILILLEELVDGMILQNEIKPCDQEYQMFRKLKVLESLFCHTVTPEMVVSLCSQDEMSSWIRYPADDAVPAYFRSITNRVQHFNTTMRRIYEMQSIRKEPEIVQTEGTQIYHRHRSAYNSVAGDQERAKLDIHRAQKLCEASNAIIEVFENTPQICQPPHSAHIHLSGFDEPVIDMLVSLCGVRTEKWHIVHWSRSKRTAQPTSGNCFCTALKESRRYRNRLRIQLQHDGAWIDSETIQRIEKCATAPKMNLRQWLDGRSGRAAAKLKPSRLTRKDILNLALTIARSLLYLSGSPLLQRPWNAENVYITETPGLLRDDSLLVEPYVAGQLTKPLAEDSTSSDKTKAFILCLASLLWELFFGKEVTVTDADIEDDDDDDEDDGIISLFNALNREHSSSKDSSFLDPSYLDIIDNCLNLYAKANLADVAFRTDLYWDVVKPLEVSLEGFLPSNPTLSAIELRSATAPLSQAPWSSRPIPRPPAQLEPNSVHELKEANATAGHTLPLNKKSLPSSLSSKASFLDLHGKILNSYSWLERFDHINQLPELVPKDGTKAVRLAVLDTGCDPDHEFFCGAGNRQDDRLRNHWHDCLGASDNLRDEDPERHGTAMVALLLRLIPTAEIYVVRVAKDQSNLSASKKNIEIAIRHIVKLEWDIDIVSMSFGFPDEIAPISEAIREAEKVKKGRILFFAAANNDGLNMSELFPALHESVISVRATRHEGSFVPQYNPAPSTYKPGSIYGTLGSDVACGWATGCLMKSGCSVATPIMAAIAAATIRYVACQDEEFPKEAQTVIRTRRGILSVFDLMSENHGGTERYVAPWQLLQGKSWNTDLIRFGLGRLPRQAIE